MVYSLYSDGGTIGRNPSGTGGVWAWCHVDRNGERIQEKSGVLLPGDVKKATVSNNAAELYALLRGLRALPDGWKGTVYCDSKIALGWVFKGWKQDKIPAHWRPHVKRARMRLGEVKTVLLKGHPFPDELKAGKAKNGRPVSIHNVWCDEACQEEAKVMDPDWISLDGEFRRLCQRDATP